MVKSHLGVPGSIFPLVLVEFCYFIVDVIVNVSLWFRACKWRCCGCTEFFQLICFFISPNTGVGGNPSQIQGVGGSETIEGIELRNLVNVLAFDVEYCHGLDRR